MSQLLRVCFRASIIITARFKPVKVVQEEEKAVYEQLVNAVDEKMNAKDKSRVFRRAMMSVFRT